MPSATRKFVFNGDFVDRGEYGVEVMCLLLALVLAGPGNVALNRGNHEDLELVQVYGFRDECVEKYDDEIFDQFIQVFRHLPLFTMLDREVFIVHGGLFIDRTVKLAELAGIDRQNYESVPELPYPDCLEGLDAAGQWAAFYR